MMIEDHQAAGTAYGREYSAANNECCGSTGAAE